MHEGERARESTSSHHMSADDIIDTDIHAHLVPIRIVFDSQALTPFLGKEPCLDSQIAKILPIARGTTI